MIGDACAVTDIFNGFEATFNAPSALPLSTQYSLELSNKAGSFNANTLVLDRKLPANDRVVTFSFNYPENDGTGETLGSETYRVRVIIEGQSTIFPGVASDRFYAYFYNNSPLILEPRQLCTPTGELRASEGFESYRWFRNNVRIPGETGRILNVTQSGRYFFIPEFGSCISPSGFNNLRSNDAVVADEMLDVDITISASTNSICANDVSVLSILNPQPTFEYQWVRNGNQIPGANSSTFNATGINAGGEYSLEVIDNAGDLIRCTQPSNRIIINLLNPSIRITSPQRIVVIPGVDNILTAEVTGGAPRTITWFRDGTAIQNSNTTSLTASLPGMYTAEITATSPCSINTVTASETVVITAIDNLSITIDYDNPEYSSCNFSRIGLQVTEISSITAGVTTLVPSANFELLNIVWLRDGNLTEFTGSSILIEDTFLNGDYQARVAAGVNFDSNVRQVQINAGELQIETTNNNLNLNESATLSVILSDTAIPSAIDYQWFQNSILQNGETNQEFVITRPGNYTVEVTFDGCTTRLEPTNVSTVSQVIPNVLTPTAFNNNTWRLPPEFTAQPDVRIQILSQRGEEIFNQTNYNGDWPNDQLKESIYYYIISRNNNPVEQGTITIIR